MRRRHGMTPTDLALAFAMAKDPQHLTPQWVEPLIDLIDQRIAKALLKARDEWAEPSPTTGDEPVGPAPRDRALCSTCNGFVVVPCPCCTERHT